MGKDAGFSVREVAGFLVGFVVVEDEGLLAGEGVGFRVGLRFLEGRFGGVGCPLPLPLDRFFLAAYTFKARTSPAARAQQMAVIEASVREFRMVIMVTLTPSRRH